MPLITNAPQDNMATDKARVKLVAAQDSAQSNKPMPMPTGWQSFTQDTFGLLKKLITFPSHDSKSSVAGQKPLETVSLLGNSGATFKQALVKFHEEAREEGDFCRHLGPSVAPVVYTVSDKYTPGSPYYVMEALQPAPRTPDLLIQMEQRLSAEVWPRSQYFGVRGDIWQSVLKNVYDVDVPKWYIPVRCLMHGDPTICNVMSRNGQIVFIDPVWFREYVPSCAAADRGKLLQSVAGWECLTFNEPYVDYLPPSFAKDPAQFREALFWCAVNMRRVLKRELARQVQRENVKQWCEGVYEICMEHIQ